MDRAWLALAVFAAALTASMFIPASGERTYLVSSNFPVKALVNGVEKILPTSVGYGDRVCVPETVYLDEGTRIVFKGWAGAGRDLCVTVTDNLTATYVREYLVHVYAQPPALRRSEWVEEGSFLKLDYPPIYNESDGVRWVFQAWSFGETPFQPSNRVYVMKPLRLEAQYVKEYRLLAVSSHNVKVNGSGWYREGALAVVAGPKEVYIGNQTRLTLVEWMSAGSTPAIVISQSSPGVAVLEVRGPHIVLAKYRAEHYVSVKGPQGVIYAGWVGEGDELRLTAPEHIQLGQDVRLRFAGWGGLEGLRSPELSLRVSGPVQAEALYVKQYLLSVSSPVGAGGAGWYDEGSKAVVTVPENPPANIFVKRRLSGFTGDCGECVHSKGVLTLKMDMPRAVVAVYTSEPDFVNLGILAGVVVAGGAAYIANHRRPGVKKTVVKDGDEGGVKNPVCKTCGSTVPADAVVCPYCGTSMGSNGLLNPPTKHRLTVET
jgi:hypothetical protein